MIIKKHFDVAGIDTYEGTIRINSEWVSRMTKHVNVDVEIDTETNRVIVTGEKVGYYPTLFNTVIDPEEVVNQDTELYKPWPWSKPRLRTKPNTIVELKKREPRRYEGNNYIIIGNNV